MRTGVDCQDSCEVTRRNSDLRRPPLVNSETAAWGVSTPPWRRTPFLPAHLPRPLTRPRAACRRVPPPVLGPCAGPCALKRALPLRVYAA
jgi:hypothetical protein